MFENFKQVVIDKLRFSDEHAESFFWILVKEFPAKTAEAIEFLGAYREEAGQKVAKVFLEAFIELNTEAN